MGTLYIIATPIGNLEDITLRALRILKEVDMVLCEDTRVTRKLLSQYDIRTPVQSYHEYSDQKKTDFILKKLADGKSLALVSDAGTPGVSDPGSMLVDLIRKELGENFQIVSVPGASALTALLSVAGDIGETFTFKGFVPHKKGRETFFKQLSTETQSAVFYESVHRIMKTLEKLSSVLSPERRVIVAKELTKMHEEIRSGTPEEVYRYFTEHPDKIRGEFAIVVTSVK